MVYVRFRVCPCVHLWGLGSAWNNLGYDGMRGMIMINYNRPYRAYVGSAYYDFATAWEAREWATRTGYTYTIENTITKEIIARGE